MSTNSDTGIEKKYTIGVALKSNSHTIIWNFRDLKGRMFTVYEWDENTKITKETRRWSAAEKKYIDRVYDSAGAWRPIVQYKGNGSWGKLEGRSAECVTEKKDAALAFHQTFKDIDEFYDWIGSEAQQKLILDLL